MAAKLRKAKAILEKQEASYDKKVQVIQAKCKHIHIAHTDNTFCSDGYGMNDRRICMDCGYEEEGSTWSGSGDIWSLKDHSAPSKLKTIPGRYVITVSRDEFYKHRV